MNKIKDRWQSLYNIFILFIKFDIMKLNAIHSYPTVCVCVLMILNKGARLPNRAFSIKLKLNLVETIKEELNT